VPDLILTDIMMPVMDGIQAAQLLSADPVTCHIPILALTALHGDDIRSEAETAGISEILQKTAPISDLIAKLQPYLANLKTLPR
jgi:two-component system cell cycle response regulator DivK